LGKKYCDTLSEAICPFMKGVVWGSSCSIWWQNTDLENFVRENSEVWLTYYFYWLRSFKVYNNAYVNDVLVNVWKTRFLLFFSWCPFLSNFLLRCQTYFYANPVTYPVACAHEWDAQTLFVPLIMVNLNLMFVASNTKILFSFQITWENWRQITRSSLHTWCCWCWFSSILSGMFSRLILVIIPRPPDLMLSHLTVTMINYGFCNLTLWYLLVIFLFF
jgi:hypothetical protein